MKSRGIRLLIGIAGACASLPAAARAELVRNPTAVGANFDLGQVVRGYVENSANNNGTLNGQVLTRTGVYVTESGIYNDRLSIRLTVGGLFWYPLTEGNSFATRLIHFGPGVGQAQGEYAFGDVKSPAAKLQFGLFPLKYNPDAKNLGEYLYRSGTYPGYIQTGGWSFLDAAAYMAQGARLNLSTFGGKVVHDATVFMERDIEPNGDLSPGYMLTLKPASFFEFGGGVVWAHGFQLRADTVVAPNIAGNAYDKTNGRPLAADGLGIDTSAACLADPTRAACAGVPSNAIGYYTFKGFKVMARTSLDFGAMLNSEAIPPGSFKLYGEMALLGVKDYPYYYAKKIERMPMMVGLDIPTFRLLDMLSVEVESRKSRFPDNISSTLQTSLPVPTDAPQNYPDTSTYTKDDIHWSIYARKRIRDGISLCAQAASDHFRPFDNLAAPSYMSATNRTGQWYYIFRLEIGI